MSTLKDVISHPLYKQYALTPTVDVDRMRNVVTLHDHNQRLTDLVKRYKLTEIVRGGHYKECVWSNPDCKCGPDTCICSHVSFECYHIIRILDILKNEGGTTTVEITN